MEEKFKSSENLLIQMKPAMREEVLEKTHGKVLERVIFFKNRDVEFIANTLKDLKPMNFHSEEVIFSQGDNIENNLYFIYEGSVKIKIDMKEIVVDETLAEIFSTVDRLEFEKYFGMDTSEITITRPTVKNIL